MIAGGRTENGGRDPFERTKPEAVWIQGQIIKKKFQNSLVRKRLKRFTELTDQPGY
jgi:hypothetical protein